MGSLLPPALSKVLEIQTNAAVKQNLVYVRNLALLILVIIANYASQN